MQGKAVIQQKFVTNKCCVCNVHQKEVVTSSIIDIMQYFSDSEFHHVLNVVFFLLGVYPASEFYVLVFLNTLSVPSS